MRKVRLNEPVDRLLPESADRRVLRRLDAEVDDPVPAKRPITVESLLHLLDGSSAEFPELLPARWCWPTPDAVSQLRS